MSTDRSKAFDPRAADRHAADWIARRDRGLSAAEQDDYLQWLREDARHAALIARHEATVRRLQDLAHWQPASSSQPNPDLFARSPRRAWRRAGALTMLAALAAAVALAGFLWWRAASETPLRPAAAALLRVNERRALADGSVVELRDGSRIELAFSARERRVRLIGGEAHFTVAKDAARPFIVEAAGVAVRAVGTVFSVRLDAAAVDVLVTEGKVRVEPPSAPGTQSGSEPRDSRKKAAQTEPEAALVTASHRALVSLAPAAPPPEVTAVTPEQIKDALGWQAPRFQFFETPLTDAAAEFNQRNQHKLVLGDGAVGDLRIGGTFRVDNVEGFVSLLELTMGVRAERRGSEETILLAPR